ncbi:MAG: DivIVA domain-containing protein, partial [Raoultibacter sp.]
AIESYLQTLEFKKKSIGGCDEEDVFLKIKGLSELYQAEIDRLQKRAIASEQRTAEYERRSQEVRQLMAAAQNMKDNMLAKALADAEQLVATADQRASMMVDGAADDAEDIVAKAQAEAELIVSKAESEANDIRKAAIVDADARRTEAEQSMVDFVERDKRIRADIKRQADTAYAKVKVAKDNLENVLESLSDIQSSYTAR